MRRTLTVALLVTGMLLAGCRESAEVQDEGTVGGIEPVTAADSLRYAENTIEVAEENEDGVVFVTRFDAPRRSMFDPFSGGSGFDPVPSGTGSGFFIDDDGFIITNYHVIEGADQVSVRLHESNRDFPARIVGIAPAYDLALLQAQDVPEELFDPLELGDSDAVRVGEKAIALGAPFGLEFTVTQGIVSAKNRLIPTGIQQIPQNALQTDAAINPGNSGGPLVNSAGEVIGVNTQILSPGTAAAGVGQSAGVGFAIPVNVVKAILERLRAGEEVGVPRIGIVGLPLVVLPPAAREQLDLPASGVLVQDVEPGSPAASADLQGGTQAVDLGGETIALGGDVITAIDGQEVTTVQDIQSALIARQPGDTVTVTVLRDGEEVEEELTL